jgi:hypothetical protein
MSLFFKFLILVLILFFAQESQAQFKPSEQQYLSEENLSINGGFEQGLKGWTNASGTLSTDTTKALGTYAGKVVLSAQTLNLSQTLSTGYNSQLAGLQGQVSAYVKANFAFQICALIDSVEVECLDGTNDNTYKFYQIPIVLGSTAIGIRFKTSGNVSGSIFIDGVSFGHKQFVQDIAQAELAGEAYFAGSVGCVWSRTSTTIGAFTATPACPSPTITYQQLGQWQTTDSDLPRVTINNLPAGIYKARFQSATSSNVVNNKPAFAIHDGTSTCYAVTASGSTTVDDTAVIECIFNYSSSGNRSFELYTASSSGSVNMNNAVTSPAQGTKFILEYYPPKSKIVTQQISDWFVDANIGGANIGLAGSALTTYTEISNASLDLVLRSGSAQAEIPCSSTNPSTGLTCSVGNESLGIVFTPPQIGYYDVCASFTQYNPPNSNSNPIYQLIETPNNAQTILQEGGQRTQTGGGTVTSVDQLNGINVCGTFYFPNLNERTVRLMYEYTFGSSASSIFIDRSPSQGQRDLRITVKPSLNKGIIVGEFNQIKTTDLCTVIANTNDGDAIAVGEDIPWKTEIKDDCNLWSNAGNTGANTNDAYTARIDGLIMVTGSAHSNNSNAGGNNVKVYENGINMNIECGLNDNLLFQTGLSCLVPVVKNSVYTFRYATAETLGIGLDHRITITEMPDLAGIVKNLNDNSNVKCQTKTLVSDVSVTGNISALQFTNLNSSKKYQVDFLASLSSAITGAVSFYLQLRDQSSNVISPTISDVKDIGAGSNWTSFYESIIFSGVTQVNFNVQAISSIIIRGSTWDLARPTKAVLCELPSNYVETTEW